MDPIYFDNNHLHPYSAAYPHLSTTSTPALSTTTTRPSTPESPHQLDRYPWHLYPPAPASDPPIHSRSKQHTCAALSDLLAEPSQQFQPRGLKQSAYRPTRLSHTFSTDTMDTSTSAPATSAANMHQSQTYLFPEQPSSYRATSSAGYAHPQSQHHPHDHSRDSPPYPQHHNNGGPALQVAHPSTTAVGGINVYKHRSASPWDQPHQQQHHHRQDHLGGGSTGYSNSSTAMQNHNNALSVYNNPHNSYDAYGLHSNHHPLTQTHAPLEYNFPPAGYAIHDPYRSPDQLHSNLPYDYPVHSHMQHHSQSLTSRNSSLLDKHLSSHSRGNTPLDHNQYSSSISRMSTKHSSSAKAEQNQKTARQRTTSTMKAASSTTNYKPATAAASSNTSKGAKSGDNDEDAHEDAQLNSYGIIDESTTTLWDLKDGPDGPRGKPPYPYLTLIRVALLSCEAKRLTLQELYDTLESRYPFFQGDQKGWKNSIRHNLSLNKCFKKETRHVLNPGKGSYWYCDPTEEYSTPRVRARRDLPVNGKKSGGAKGKKRKVAESLDSGDGEGSDVYQPDYSYNDCNNNDYPFNDIIGRSVKVRVGDLKLPFNLASGAGGSGSTTHLNNKRQRAISAPSPITPSFFNNFDTSGFTSHEHGTDAGVAPFGMTGTSSSVYGTHLQPYSFPSVFHQPTQAQNYELPLNHQDMDEMSKNGRHLQPHHLPPLPGLINDTTPHSGATDSTFALETPRTIYSVTNATARPGTANSINTGGISDNKSGPNALDRNVKEENTSANILLNNSAITAYTSPVLGHVSPAGEHGQEGEGVNRVEEVIPGPAPAYVFPATQKSYNDPGQTKRVFVNPSGITTTTITPNSPPRQSPHHVGVHGNTLNTNNNGSNSAIMNSNILRSPSNNSTTTTPSNPFAVPLPTDEGKTRPAPLFLSDKQGKQFFSPPSATSPSRHLPTEYDNMFSTAPFGMIFEAPSSKGSSPRKENFFNGLVAR